MGVRPLQILFRGEAVKTVAELQKKSGANSKAEVIRDAIMLYKFIDEIATNGEVIVKAKESDKGQLITIPKKKLTSIAL